MELQNAPKLGLVKGEGFKVQAARQLTPIQILQRPSSPPPPPPYWAGPSPTGFKLNNFIGQQFRLWRKVSSQYLLISLYRRYGILQALGNQAQTSVAYENMPLWHQVASSEKSMKLCDYYIWFKVLL